MTIEELKKRVETYFVYSLGMQDVKYPSAMFTFIDQAVSIATKEAVERVCKSCKYLDEYLMCSNPKVLNGSNFIPEFINAKQAENFGCTKWELSTPQPENEYCEHRFIKRLPADWEEYETDCNITVYEKKEGNCICGKPIKIKED